MAYIGGHARAQALLLKIKNYVAADNQMRFTDAFVVDLGLGAASFQRSQPNATGRTGYDQADMLKLYLYGHINQMGSR